MIYSVYFCQFNLQGQAVIQTRGHARGDVHHHALDQDLDQALMISMSRRNVGEEEVLW